jgi:nitroreductase/NAD-dependent dihydropyrimidine dehydrogenase PreA subunit
MSAIAVDDSRCDRCGICVLECPVAIIRMADAGALPASVEGRHERCIACGHCVAVCPRSAVSLDGTRPEDCSPVTKDLLPKPEEVELFLKSRRSIRAYRDESVPRDELAKLIDIARYAPSGLNTQPVQWLVIESTPEVRRLAGLVAEWMRAAIGQMPEMAEFLGFGLLVADWDRGTDRILRGAPHLVIAHAPTDDILAPQAAPIALTYLELAAYSIGLGACWAGFFQTAATFAPSIAEALRLPSGHQSLGAMMVGYPRHRFQRIPVRKLPEVTSDVWT